MERRGIKNIIIVLLLIINVLLLVLVGAQRGETLRYEQSALERALLVMEKNGIRMESDAVVSMKGLPPASLERSTELEARMASALLGAEVESKDLGGGLYSYTAPSGEVSFRPGGGISARLAENILWYAADPPEHCGTLMKTMSVEYRPLENTLSDGTGMVLCQQLLEDSPLFSCQVAFVYEDGVLTGLVGTLLAGEEVVREEADVLTLPTVLMGFLDEVLTGGDVCSEILQVEPGYLPSQSFSGTVDLRPVWHITTNVADYYVDGITGEVTRAAVK